MDFKQLQTFRTAARTLNFTETARQLHYVQSAVTAHIRSLEERLDVRLFDRSGRGVVLTSAGEQLLEYADRIVSLRDEAEQSVKKTQIVSGRLTLAGYETVLTYRLPGILKAYTEQYPKVRVNITSLNVRELLSQVANHQIDLAFLLDKEAALAHVEKRLVGLEKVVIVADPEHKLAHKKKVMARDLEGQPLLLTELGCSYRNVFETVLKNSGVIPEQQMEFISIEAIKACVKMGMGIAAISEVSVAEELQRGELVSLDWQDETLSLGLYMVWNANRWVSPALAAFIENTIEAGTVEEGR
ncbi:LysR family transcriptional regulator [Endozoicomonas numazuensis]|uniref:LysR family transcriptional regulator n=1 Tax=Endozoicomonas numazuensis TaxID=1137799 RepID=UPI000552ADD9|nr:LysR family transcriptional regulator [Endozoicomonas numazuensis]